MKIMSNTMKSTICLMPWISSSIKANGEIRLCCAMDQDDATLKNLTDKNGQTYNVNTHGIHDIRNNDFFKKIRSDFLKGKKPAVCKSCWNKEKLGIETKRKGFLLLYKHFKYDVFEHTEEDGTIDINKFPIIYYDLRMGNLCNSRCLTCGPGNSSMFGKYIPWTNNIYYKDVKNNLDDIKELYFAGGELLINKYYFELVDKLIESGNAKNIYLRLITNASVMKKEFIDQWKHFKRARIVFSIDGIEDTFEKIRTPTKWDNVENNLKFFDKEVASSTVFGNISPTISTLNIFEMPALFNWISNSNFENIDKDILFNFLYVPTKFSIRKRIDIYEQTYEIYKPFLNGDSKHYYEKILNFIKG